MTVAVVAVAFGVSALMVGVILCWVSRDIRRDHRERLQFWLETHDDREQRR